MLFQAICLPKTTFFGPGTCARLKLSKAAACSGPTGSCLPTLLDPGMWGWGKSAACSESAPSCTSVLPGPATCPRLHGQQSASLRANRSPCCLIQLGVHNTLGKLAACSGPTPCCPPVLPGPGAPAQPRRCAGPPPEPCCAPASPWAGISDSFGPLAGPSNRSRLLQQQG